MSSPLPVKSEAAIAVRDPLALAQALLRAPSVTPHAEGAVALVAQILESAGYEVTLLPFDSAGTPIANLYARIGTGAP
ncbi:MAG: hypothetical protein B7Y61_12330, partial [Rhizobiales bacterium 35-66-30]